MKATPAKLKEVEAAKNSAQAQLQIAKVEQKKLKAGLEKEKKPEGDWLAEDGS